MGIKNWVHNNLRTIIITSFLIPILLVAFVSIAHVTTWYELSNPISWAIYLSAAIEIAALGALAGLSVNMGRFIYVPFGIVTFIQLLGNVFFSFSFIDVTSKMFQDWVLMVGPVFEPMGVEATDLTAHRRILSFLAGGFLPLISLTFAHMLVRFSEETMTSKDNSEVKELETEVKEINEVEVEVKEITSDDIEEFSKEAGKLEATIVEEPYKPTQEEIDRLQAELDKLLSKKVETTTEELVEESVEEDEVSEENNEEPQVRQINRLTYSPRNASNTEN
jgi:hypothetical protein